jgi:hypothetical protein
MNALSGTMMAGAALPTAGLILASCTKKEEGAAPQDAAPAAPAADAGAGEPKKLDENDPVAKALGYSHDASKVDVAKYPKRAGAEGQKQFCHNCAQFNAGADAWGKCNIFPQGMVNKDGWCNSWVQKS